MVLRTLLLVDDCPGLGRSLCDALSSWRIVVTTDRDSAMHVVHAHKPPVAVVSFALPDGTGDPVAGLGALTDILAEAPGTKVIMLARGEDRSLAVKAVVQGAHDVYRRPPDGAVDVAELAVVIERAFHRHELEAEGRRLGALREPPTLRAVRDEAERRAVIDTLARVNGNMSAAARMLAVSRPTLYNLIRQHGLRAE